MTRRLRLLRRVDRRLLDLERRVDLLERSGAELRVRIDEVDAELHEPDAARTHDQATMTELPMPPRAAVDRVGERWPTHKAKARKRRAKRART